MPETGLLAFDHTLQKTHIYLNDLAAQLGIEDKKTVFQGLRATLQCLRDRIPPEEAAQLGAQLPVLLAGFYYQGWKPGASPSKERSLEEFLDKVRSALANDDNYPISIEELVKGVFTFLANKVTQGEIEDIANMMPEDLKPLWPEAVRS
ncbi:MAG: DUF2267 domain-containing protein [Cyanophyceae cyanobacterium]